MEETLFTAGEAAKRLGVHRTTVYRWVKTGVLTPVGVLSSGVALFTAESLTAIKRGENEA